MGENIYVLPNDMKLGIRYGTVGYNSKILISDSTFNVGKNEKVNTLELAKISRKVVLQPLLNRNELPLTKRKKRLASARSKFWGVSGSENRGGGDNSIQFINIGREGDKSFKEWRRKIEGWKGG